MAHLQTRYTDQPIYFPTGLRSAVAVTKFNFLYRPLLFRPPILKPLDRSQICRWLAVSISSPPGPPVGSRKTLGPNLYRTHQNDTELSSKSTATPELLPQPQLQDHMSPGQYECLAISGV